MSGFAFGGNRAGCRVGLGGKFAIGFVLPDQEPNGVFVFTMDHDKRARIFGRIKRVEDFIIA